MALIEAKGSVADAIVNGERSEKGASPCPFTIAAAKLQCASINAIMIYKTTHDLLFKTNLLCRSTKSGLSDRMRVEYAWRCNHCGCNIRSVT